MQGRPTVLIVEDDPRIRGLMRSLLEDYFTVAEASNGVVALVQAWDARPQVILLDLEMPAMTGEEAAPYLRVLSPASRIVAFSSSLDSKPLWADTFADKADTLGAVELIRQLADAASPEPRALTGSALRTAS